MAVRRLKIAVAALAVVATAGPALADPPDKDGVNLGLAGVVQSSGVHRQQGVGEFPYHGNCDFGGVILPPVNPDGDQVVRFRGTVTAHGPLVPIVADVKCEIYNDFGNAHSAEARISGGTVAVSGSTLDDVAGGPTWPLQPITICVSGSVVFGPTPAVTVPVPRKCKRP